MTNNSIWLMIIGISVVSLLPRILPVALLSRFEFPKIFNKWLTFVGPAVLGALTAISILAPEGELFISLKNKYLWAFIPTFLVAIKTRSLLYTLLIGILTMALLYNFVIF